MYIIYFKRPTTSIGILLKKKKEKKAHTDTHTNINTETGPHECSSGPVYIQ